MTPHLTVELADAAGLVLAQRLVAKHHYLHAPADPRCRPLAYLVRLHLPRAVFTAGALIFGRPEATRCYPWFGSVEDVQARRARLSRWEVINLARVWLAPAVQEGGRYHIPCAATRAVAQALRQLPFDYLAANPPCFLNEPWALREVLSYCDSTTHRGTLYRAANFALIRENGRGLQTWARPLRPLHSHERAHIERLARQSPRSRLYRSQRAVEARQEVLL